MTNAWEETWTLTEDGIELPDDKGFPATVRGSWTRPEQERLAAAAPELVRALLAIEAKAIAECSACPSCAVPVTYYTIEKEHLHDPYLTHAVDCGLDLALRKAGVR